MSDCIELRLWSIPVAVDDVLPLALQQHGGDAVLALQQQKGVQTAAEHIQQSRETHRSY